MRWKFMLSLTAGRFRASYGYRVRPSPRSIRWLWLSRRPGRIALYVAHKQRVALYWPSPVDDDLGRMFESLPRPTEPREDA